MHVRNGQIFNRFLLGLSALVLCAPYFVNAESHSCTLQDEECFTAIECPEDLDEEECDAYRRGTVAAARVEPLIAHAGEDVGVLVHVEVNFVADESQIPSTVDAEFIEYVWDFGDASTPVRGNPVSYKYPLPGSYSATLTIISPTETSEDTRIITVNTKALFLIRGENRDPIEVTNVLNRAKRHDFLVHEIIIDEDGNDFVIEDRLINALLDTMDELQESSLLIGWTGNSNEVNALVRLGTQLGSELFSNKEIVIASSRISLTSRRTQPVVDVLTPKSVVVIAPTLIETAIKGAAEGTLAESIQSEGEDFVLLGNYSRRNFGTVTFYNFLSHFINTLVNRGVPVNTILLLLMLPIVATIISFTRQVIGVKSFGVYIPTILALTFVAIGLQAGLLIIFLIVAIGTLVRFVVKRLRLLYLPRMALVITMVSLIMLLVFFLSDILAPLALVSISIFPILILIMLVEEFIRVQIEEGTRPAFILTFETIVLSMISYFIVNNHTVRDVLLSYPEIIFLTIIMNIILGKWTGLRLWEYYRFREILQAMKRVDK